MTVFSLFDPWRQSSRTFSNWDAEQGSVCNLCFAEFIMSHSQYSNTVDVWEPVDSEIRYRNCEWQICHLISRYLFRLALVHHRMKVATIRRGLDFNRKFGWMDFMQISPSHWQQVRDVWFMVSRPASRGKIRVWVSHSVWGKQQDPRFLGGK